MKPVHWVGSSREDLKSFPTEVNAILALRSIRHSVVTSIRPQNRCRAFGGASVLEIVENHDGDTYRAVYTVRFAEAIYVLHCFQKKSKRGIKTPKKELDLIETRLKKAQEDYEQWLKAGKP